MIIVIVKLLLIIKLIVIFVLLLRPVLLFRKELKRKEYLKQDTYNRVKNFGVVTSITGPQRSGKTLTISLLCHELTLIIQDELQERIDKIISSYVNLDFNNINYELDNRFTKENKCNAKEIYFEMFDGLRGVNFDFLNMRSVKKDLIDYIDFYYMLNYRNNYLLTNFYIFNRITLSKSKCLNSDTLELKNLWKTLNYIGDRGIVIARDELNVENGNVNSNNKEVKTSGLKDFSSLIGNMYEELTRLVTGKQIKEDEFVGTRRLEVTKLEMNSCREVIYNFKFLQDIIDKWLSFRYKLFTFKYKFILSKKKRFEMIDKNYLKANSKYRKIEFFWNGVKSYLNAQGLIVINVDITENKKTTEEVELFFPVKWGYGTYRTHDYTCVHQELSRISKTSYIETEDNIRFDTPQKIKQKCKFLYENKEKEEKEKQKSNKEVREVVDV